MREPQFHGIDDQGREIHEVGTVLGREIRTRRVVENAA